MTANDFYLAAWTVGVSAVCNTGCALLGCFLVLRRMSLLGDAISHGVLPGIVLAVLVTGQLTGWPVVLGAMAFGLLTALLTQAVQQIAGVPEDASMGVVFSALFALGVYLISAHPFHADLDTECVLYGTLEQVPLRYFRLLGWRVPQAFPTMAAMLAVTVVFLLAFWKELKISSFDPGLATAMGLNATLVHYLLMAMVAGVTVTAFEAVGSVIVVAMLVVPAATAHLLTDRLSHMLLWAAAVAIVSSAAGFVLASGVAFNTNAAGMMAAVAGFLFLLAVLFAPRHGVLAKVLRTFRLSLRIASEDVLGSLYRVEEATSRGDTAKAERGTADLRRVTSTFVGGLAMRSLLRRGEVKAATGAENALTDLGRRRAAQVVRAHRLWETYLGQHFDLPLDHLHEPAERMEHYLGPDLQSELDAELGRSGVDPHGRPIPRPEQSAADERG